MKFPIIIKDGKSLITFTGLNHRSVTNNEAYDEQGKPIHSSFEDMMLRVESGKAEIISDPESKIINIRLQDKLYRLRSGNVESSVNNGRHWMSTNKTGVWFFACREHVGTCYAQLGQFIG